MSEERRLYKIGKTKVWMNPALIEKNKERYKALNIKVEEVHLTETDVERLSEELEEVKMALEEEE